MTNIQQRAFNVLNLDTYKFENKPDKVSYLNITPPDTQTYILRMLIKRPFNEIRLPSELSWTREFIDTCIKFQEQSNIKQPFIYLTVRSGFIESITDDEWHVDGFSTTITHLPEQNYIWSNNNPTQYIVKGISFPSNFDPLKHNIHKFIQNRITDNDAIQICDSNTIYAIDPYIIHKRPTIKDPIKRCFLRLSFIPIELEDVNNTVNPLIKTNYTRDGVKAFRDNLIDFDKHNKL